MLTLHTLTQERRRASRADPEYEYSRLHSRATSIIKDGTVEKGVNSAVTRALRA